MRDSAPINVHTREAERVNGTANYLLTSSAYVNLGFVSNNADVVPRYECLEIYAKIGVMLKQQGRR